MQDAIILYENGKAIGGEGHPTDADDITFDNTGTDIEANKVGSAIKEVNAKTSGLTRMTKLWENPSPTASFSAQNVTLSSGDYDVLLITPTGLNGTPLIIDKGGTGYLFYPTYGSSSTDAWTYLRQVTYVDDTHLNFGNVISDSSKNQYCVPKTIYGIKII